MGFNLLIQLIKYNDHLPRHIKSGLLWFRAGFLNHIAWIRRDSEKVEKVLKLAESKKWVFILGCNNSGTSLLYHLLSKHYQIASFPIDGQFLTTVFKVPMTLNVGRLWTEKIEHFRLTEKDTDIDHKRLIFDWMSQIKSDNRPIIIEKSTPDTIRSRWLQNVFPSSYFIGITRNGYAVAEGISRRKRVDIRRGARHWIMANNLMINDAKFLSKLKMVKYEDLVEKPESVVFDILEFIGADKESYNMDFQKRIRLHNIDRKSSVIRNFNEKSIKRIPKQVLHELALDIEPVMKRLGY